MGGFEKDLKISVLLDLYGRMLTDRQAKALEMYYNGDLSLGEISENTGITRQGVRDFIKRGEKTLLEIEKKLEFYEKFNNVTKKISEALTLLSELEALNGEVFKSKEMDTKLKKIKKILSEIEV